MILPIRAIQFSEILDFQSLRIRCRRELRFPTFPIHWTKTLKLSDPVLPIFFTWIIRVDVVEYFITFCKEGKSYTTCEKLKISGSDLLTVKNVTLFAKLFFLQRKIRKRMSMNPYGYWVF